MQKVDTDKRNEERFHWCAYCRVSDGVIYNQTLLMTKTQDISKNGLKIRYIGEPLPPETRVNIHIMNLNLQRAAKIIWSKALNELDTLAGLRLLEPIPIPQSLRLT